MKKKKIYKVGVESETYAISLVESPAIEETLVALEEQKPIKVQMADEEKYMVYSAVLVPDRPIFRRNEQGEEFYIQFTKESIEKMSQEFLQNYKQNEITLDHQTMANDITLVEQWIKADPHLDKSVAIGLSEELPVGSWVAGLKVNQIDTWKRIKEGSLRGFSVESLVSLEEFSKQDEQINNNNMETNDMKFWTKLKEVMSEVLASVSMSKVEEENVIEPIAAEDLSEQTPTEPTPEPQPTEAPKAEETVVETPAEPQPTEAPKAEETVVEEPQPQEAPDNHLEDLIKSLKDEVEALKKLNSGLDKKVKTLEKTPSVAPINVQAKPSGGDNYSSWREQMAKML